MAKEAYVVKEECTSCGVCTDTLPEVFQYDSEDKAEVYDSAGAAEDRIQEAMDLCPAACIKWKE